MDASERIDKEISDLRDWMAVIDDYEQPSKS
jgi:hypothetical protein